MGNNYKAMTYFSADEMGFIFAQFYSYPSLQYEFMNPDCNGFCQDFQVSKLSRWPKTGKRCFNGKKRSFELGSNYDVIRKLVYFDGLKCGIVLDNSRGLFRSLNQFM